MALERRKGVTETKEPVSFSIYNEGLNPTLSIPVKNGTDPYYSVICSRYDLTPFNLPFVFPPSPLFRAEQTELEFSEGGFGKSCLGRIVDLEI